MLYSELTVGEREREREREREKGACRRGGQGKVTHAVLRSSRGPRRAPGDAEGALTWPRQRNVLPRLSGWSVGGGSEGEGTERGSGERGRGKGGRVGESKWKLV